MLWLAATWGLALVSTMSLWDSEASTLTEVCKWPYWFHLLKYLAESGPWCYNWLACTQWYSKGGGEQGDHPGRWREGVPIGTTLPGWSMGWSQELLMWGAVGWGEVGSHCCVHSWVSMAGACPPPRIYVWGEGRLPLQALPWVPNFLAPRYYLYWLAEERCAYVFVCACCALNLPGVLYEWKTSQLWHDCV